MRRNPARICKNLIPLAFTLLLLVPALSQAMLLSSKDPLPSWNHGPAKERLLSFVHDVTNPQGKHYVSALDRVAVFDNDGTLWVEKPMVFQMAFTLERMRELAKIDPDLAEQQPYKALMEGDQAFIGHMRHEELEQALMVAHAGTTIQEFEGLVREWLGKAKHPRFDRPYTDLVYQPMLELLDYLSANDFKVFIVSGGGIDFIRSFSEKTYGIPVERVIGSSLVYEVQEGPQGMTLLRTDKLRSYNDRAAKPENIALHVGRRPILAFGNSDGDIPMLGYTQDDGRPSLSLLLNHDDDAREYRYLKGTEQALEKAGEQGWTVVHIKTDFKVVFPFELSAER